MRAFSRHWCALEIFGCKPSPDPTPKAWSCCLQKKMTARSDRLSEQPKNRHFFLDELQISLLVHFKTVIDDMDPSISIPSHDCVHLVSYDKFHGTNWRCGHFERFHHFLSIINEEINLCTMVPIDKMLRNNKLYRESRYKRYYLRLVVPNGNKTPLMAR